MDAAPLRLDARSWRTLTRISPLLGELDRVAEQVEQDLPQARRRRRCDGRPIAGVDVARSARGPCCGAAAASSSTASSTMSRRSNRRLSSSQLAGLDLGEVEDVVDDLQQRFGRLLDRSRHSSRCSVVEHRDSQQQLRHADARRSSACGSRGSCGQELDLARLASSARSPPPGRWPPPGRAARCARAPASRSRPGTPQGAVPPLDLDEQLVDGCRPESRIVVVDPGARGREVPGVAVPARVSARELLGR